MKLMKRNAITIGPHDASVLTFEGRRLIWRVPRRCLEGANLVPETIFLDSDACITLLMDQKRVMNAKLVEKGS